LVQEDAGEIRLLPALPSAWPTGLRARGGFEIDLSWNGGRIERVTVRSLLGQPLRLRRAVSERIVGRTTRGSVFVFAGDDLRPLSE